MKKKYKKSIDKLIADAEVFNKRLELIEKREQQYLAAAATFGTQLNLIQAKQSEINQLYEKLIKKSEDVLNYNDTLRKMAGKVHRENDAFVGWCKSLASRLQKIEENF